MRLNSKARSLDLIGMRGMNTSSPLAQPVIIVATIRWGSRRFTKSRVPLQRLGASRFLSNIIGAPTFNTSLCGGVPGGSSECRNSAG